MSTKSLWAASFSTLELFTLLESEEMLVVEATEILVYLLSLIL